MSKYFNVLPFQVHVLSISVSICIDNTYKQTGTHLCLCLVQEREVMQDASGVTDGNVREAGRWWGSLFCLLVVFGRLSFLGLGSAFAWMDGLIVACLDFCASSLFIPDTCTLSFPA